MGNKKHSEGIRKISNFGDVRQTSYCVHCGGSTETKDHAPSLVFLDEPYPLTRPTVPACTDCNNSFSDDEEYLACFIECVVQGTTDPEELSRTKVAKAIRRNRKLRQRIEGSKRELVDEHGGRTITWFPEQNRAERVAIKLARCHAAYELNEPQLTGPDHLFIGPLDTLTEAMRLNFEAPPGQGGLGVWPEVGSRAMQRLLIAEEAYTEGWLCVQEGRYRYMAAADSDVMVRGVLSEYLGYEVIWT